MSGCSSGTACTNNLRPALLVSVVDSAEAQVCNVVVTAEGPETGGPQRLTPSDCRFSGGTSAGHYVLVVSRESQPLVTTEVTVDSDECGVVTKEVKVTVPDP
ncbi:MAG TPA: hypothetical protein VHB79_02075 [Polyangiaceae bacterium]|nr:hypothetical protein [Polyangiaceae bacterium]